MTRRLVPAAIAAFALLLGAPAHATLLGDRIDVHLDFTDPFHTD
jgi:hypothetical protein